MKRMFSRFRVQTEKISIRVIGGFFHLFSNEHPKLILLKLHADLANVFKYFNENS